MATWCEELTHLKGSWCWEGLRAEGEGDDRGWDGWMASLTQWTWVDSGSWWWTRRPGVLRFTGSKRVRHDWVTELNWSVYMSDLLLDLEREGHRTLLCRSPFLVRAQRTIWGLTYGKNKFIKVRTERTTQGRYGPRKEKHWHQNDEARTWKDKCVCSVARSDSL